MEQNILIQEKHDLLITPSLKPNQLPKLLEEVFSIAPEDEMRELRNVRF